MRCPAGVLLAVVLVTPAAAQPADTMRTHVTPLFTLRDALVAGSFAAGTLLVTPVDEHFAERLQRPHTQENRFLRNTASGFRHFGGPWIPMVAATFYVAGKLGGGEKFADTGFHTGEALVLGQVAGLVMKSLAGRARPKVDVENSHDFKLGRGWSQEDYRSFPSGHTINGFTFASAMTSEITRHWPRYRWYVGSVLYTGAALVGVSRMYENKHWASDVVAGAAVGIFAGLKTVRYQHSHPGNRLDRIFLGAAVVGGGPVGTRDPNAVQTALMGVRIPWSLQ
jgi:membrane-associated phospholipid phosphatase